MRRLLFSVCWLLAGGAIAGVRWRREAGGDALNRWEELLRSDLPPLNGILQAAGTPPIGTN